MAGRNGTTDAWKRSHAKFRAEKGLQDRGFHLWSAHHSLRGVPCQPRYTDVIDLAAECWQLQVVNENGPKGDVATLLSTEWQKCPFICDFTQSADRTPWTSGHARSLCANTSLYHFQADRALVPKEMLMMLGWSSDVDLSTLSDGQIRDLAGESMGCPCIAACMAAVALALPEIWEGQQ